MRAGLRYERLKKELVSLGCEVYMIDYHQPETLVKVRRTPNEWADLYALNDCTVQAMRGADKVIFIPPLTENMVKQTTNIVDAALIVKTITHIIRFAPLANQEYSSRKL